MLWSLTVRLGNISPKRTPAREWERVGTRVKLDQGVSDQTKENSLESNYNRAGREMETSFQHSHSKTGRIEFRPEKLPMETSGGRPLCLPCTPLTRVQSLEPHMFPHTCQK